MFATISCTQETQRVALPHQMRELLNAAWGSTLEFPYDEIEARSDRDGEGQQIPVIVSTNYRRLVERIAE